MRSIGGVAVGLLRRLIGGAPPAASPQHAGAAAAHQVGEAISALEGAICEAVVHRPASTARAADLRTASAPNAFGQLLREADGSGARGCVASATGMALAGLRATCGAAGSELFELHAALATAASRLAPLVVHAALDDGHAGWHAAAETGAFLALAKDGQEAVDLTLLARWLAERALVPGVVGFEGDAVEWLALPSDALVREFLGAPGDLVACPNEAQRLLFGPERRRVVRWFDLDHPLAVGGQKGEADASRADAGRAALFGAPLLAMAREGMAELSRRTGRPLSLVRRHRLDDAELVLVAQGALVQAAEAVADHLRKEKRLRVGVLGLSWLRPFPTAEVALALADKRAIAVLERGAASLGDGPLTREVKAAAGGPEGRWLSALCAGAAPVPPSRLVALCELLQRSDRPGTVRLDLEPLPAGTGFPHRDAALAAVKAAAPAMAGALPAGEVLALAPAGGASLALLALEAELPPRALSALGAELASAAGPFVRGQVTRPWPGVIEARLRAAPADFVEPGPAAPVDVLLVAAGTPVSLGLSLGALSRGAPIVFATDEEPERLWRLFPAAWKKAVEASGLKVFVVRGGLSPARAAAIALARGQAAPAAVAVATPAAPVVADRELPEVVRRVGVARQALDSLPRYWGEVVQPRQGALPDGAADALLVSGAVPAGASALQLSSGAATLPRLEVKACTGCGKCWSACPDSALGAAAVGAEALLTAASKRAGTTGKAADALRRGHKQLSPWFGQQLAEAGPASFSRARLEAGWAHLAQALKVADADKSATESAMQATTREALKHQAVVTRPFFDAAEAQKPGSGELLVLAVNPSACTGCGLCAAACADQALTCAPRTTELQAEAASAWRAFETLPDTAGATITRAAADPAVGPLAATLLARGCAQAQVGDAESEPGSGERLAARLVAALTERHTQARQAALAKAVEARRDALESKARGQLSQAVSGPDMATLAAALGSTGQLDLAALGKRLDALGTTVKIDARAVRRLAAQAAALEEQRALLVEGADGLGRSRFGVAVLGESAALWAARFPMHPWFAPVVVDRSAEGAELALGLAHALLSRHVDLVRALRRAELLEQEPPDLDPRLAQLEALGPADLTPAERESCPPLLVLADEAVLTERGLGTLSRLLESPLPVKVVLLDGLSRLGGRAPLDLVAIAHQRAFVLASSIAHPDHLARGLEAALAWPGAALVHIHAPSPRRHGFPKDQALARARAAVEARAHLLVTYDPAAPGPFGARTRVADNPSAAQAWGALDFCAWAVGEARFAPHFTALPAGAEAVPAGELLRRPRAEWAGKVACAEKDGQKLAVSPALLEAAADRLAGWTALQELSGLVNPVADRSRDALLAELQAAHAKDLAAVKAEAEAKLLAVKATADQEVVVRVADRLVALATDTRTGQRS